MLELIIIIGLLSGFIAYLRIRLVNAETELTDFRIKHKFATDTLDTILNNHH